MVDFKKIMKQNEERKKKLKEMKDEQNKKVKRSHGMDRKRKC